MELGNFKTQELLSELILVELYLTGCCCKLDNQAQVGPPVEPPDTKIGVSCWLELSLIVSRVVENHIVSLPLLLSTNITAQATWGVTLRVTLSSLLENHLLLLPLLISPMTRRPYSRTGGSRMGVPVGAVDIDRGWRLERERGVLPNPAHHHQQPNSL